MNSILNLIKHSNSIFPFQIHYLVLFWGFIAIIALLQDYALATFHEQKFYLIECLIFKIFWLGMIFFTVVVVWVNQKLFEYNLSVSLRVTGHIAICILFSTAYFLFTSLIIGSMAHFFLFESFEPIEIFHRFIADRYYVLIIAYLVISLIFQRTKVDISTLQIDPASTNPNLPDVLKIQQGKKTHFIKVPDIDYLKAETPYAIVVANGHKYLSSENLLTLEKLLHGTSIKRIHRTMLINTTKIKFLHSRGNGDYDVHLSNNEIYRMSRRYRHFFKESDSHLFKIDSTKL